MSYLYSYSYDNEAEDDGAVVNDEREWSCWVLDPCEHLAWPSAIKDALVDARIGPEQLYVFTLCFLILITFYTCVCFFMKKSKVAATIDLERSDAGMAAATAETYNPPEPSELIYDLLLVEVIDKDQGSLGISIEKSFGGHALVSCVSKKSPILNLVKPGDILHYPGTKGAPIPYDSSSSLLKRRPVRFEVKRLRPASSLEYEFKTVRFLNPGPIGLTLSKTSADGALITNVANASAAASNGLRAGDLIYMGGKPMDYERCIGSMETRPVVFEVRRVKASSSPMSAGIPSSKSSLTSSSSPFVHKPTSITFTADYNEAESMKLNKAMNSLKRGKTLTELMPIRVSSIEAHELLINEDPGSTKVDHKKDASICKYKTYIGIYNATLPILIKQLVLFGEENAMSKSLQAWGTSAALQASLSHPNVLRLLSTCFEPELVACVYEGTTGITLMSLVRSRAVQWKDHSALLPLQQVAAGMAYIANFGAHGFLSPTNVHFTSGYQVKILNAFDSGHWTADYLATSHTNTLVYLSPSVLSGNKPSLKDDVYSFGMILFGTITEKRDTFETLMAAILEEQMFPGIPENVLSQKLQRKLAVGDFVETLKFERRSPTEIENLVEECVSKDVSKIKITFPEILERLRGPVRRQLEEPLLRAMSMKRPKPEKTPVVELGDEEEKEMKAQGENRNPEIVEPPPKTKTEVATTPVQEVERVDGVQLKPAPVPVSTDTKVEEIDGGASDDSDSDSSSEDSDSDSDISL